MWRLGVSGKDENWLSYKIILKSSVFSWIPDKVGLCLERALKIKILKSVFPESLQSPHSFSSCCWYAPTFTKLDVPRMWHKSPTQGQFRFHFLGLQNHCRWWLKLGRKAMTNLDSVLKNRDITLPAKVHIIKDMVFLVVMYGCESWTIKKAEHGRIDAFKLWSWRRLFRIPWTARRSNQLTLKEINPEYSLEWLMLKLQYFGHLTRTAI